MPSKIFIEVYADSDEVEKYGEEGLRTLWINILDWYASEEYYDPDIVEELLKERSNET